MGRFLKSKVDRDGFKAHIPVPGRIKDDVSVGIVDYTTVLFSVKPYKTCLDSKIDSPWDDFELSVDYPIDEETVTAKVENGVLLLEGKFKNRVKEIKVL